MQAAERRETEIGGLAEQYRTINGVRTFSRSLGIGEDVVLVHGAGVSEAYWRPAQAALAAAGRFRVHALDLPGFGRSGEPAAELTFGYLADHLCAWLEDAVPRPCRLVGQSLGCDLAAMAAAARPDRVRRVVLAAPAGLPVLESLAEQLIRAGLDAPRETLRLYGAILPAYFRCGLPRLFGVLREQKRDRTELLRRLRQPVLVLWGRDDPVVTRERAARVIRLLPNAAAEEVPGAHAAHFTHAEGFGRMVGQFLSSA